MLKIYKAAGIVAAASSLGLLAVEPAMAVGNLIVDGSFEASTTVPTVPTVADGDYLNVPDGSIGAWTVGGAGVDLINESYWEAQDGIQSVDMNGVDAGSLTQTVTDTAGQEYNLSFYLAANSNGPPDIKTIDVVFDGVIHSYTAPIQLPYGARIMNWTPYTFTVFGTGSDTVSFVSTTDHSGHGPALDNVSLTPVPEPAFYQMGALLGLGVLGILKGRRKTNGSGSSA